MMPVDITRLMTTLAAVQVVLLDHKDNRGNQQEQPEEQPEKEPFKEDSSL